VTEPTERVINVPLLLRTLEHIEAHPEEWNQEKWHCGSAYCFAGHAATLSGAVFVTTPGDPDPDDTIHVLGPGDDKPHAVYYYAAGALGLDPYGRAADRLFDGSNTLDDLRRVVADLTARAES
jgi:hypothetical protein